MKEVHRRPALCPSHGVIDLRKRVEGDKHVCGISKYIGLGISVKFVEISLREQTSQTAALPCSSHSTSLATTAPPPSVPPLTRPDQ